MALELQGLHNIVEVEDEEVEALAIGLTASEIASADMEDLRKLKNLLIGIENNLAQGASLPGPIMKTMQGIVKREIAEQMVPRDPSDTRISTVSSDSASTEPKAIRAHSMDVINELREKFGEGPLTEKGGAHEVVSATNSQVNEAWQSAVGRIQAAINNNTPNEMTKKDMGVFFAHANNDEVKAFIQAVSEKLGETTQDSLGGLLANRNYTDIRGNDWLTHLGSRTFIETFYNENTERFKVAVSEKPFADVVDGALHTSIQGHDKSSLSFGLFGKSASHDAETLGNIQRVLDENNDKSLKK